MSRQTAFRPFLFGEKDRRIYRVDMAEVAMRAINDGNGNPTYLGYAIIGTDTSLPRWQIRKMTYDVNNAITSVTWPVNDEGVPSNNYEFVWDDVLTYTFE